MAGKSKWRDMDDVPQGNGEKAARPDDLVKVAKFKDGKWITIRLLPGVMTQAHYWINTVKKDGGKTRFPLPVPGFDSQSGQQDSSAYDPWGAAAEKLNVYSDRKDGTDRDNSGVVIQFSKSYWMNAIIRSEQENEPGKSPKHTKAERESGCKEMDSDSWTPVQVVRLPKSFIDRVNGLKTMNVKRNKKTGSTENYSVSHPKYGCDILVKYNGSASPASQWEVQKGERTPLTEEEEALLVWDLDLLANPATTEEETKKEFESWCKRNKIKLGGSDDDEDAPKSKKKSKKSQDVDDDDDFDEPAPKKGKKKSKSDEDDDDDFDEPKAKKSKKSRDDDEDEDDEDPKPKKGKKKPVDDDEDDFDDEDDEPAPKKKSKKSRDEDDEEDDEDDDPKPRKGKKSKSEDDEDEDEDPKPKKKSKKVVDEDDDDDFDEDEDDAPKSKKKSKKSRDDDDEDEDDEPKAKKGKKKSKSDEDDDDDWGDDD